MRVGVLRETKDRELRVALLPAGARTLVAAGHEVLVETTAGEGSGFPDAEYQKMGARVVPSAEDVLDGCDIATKVKEPTLAEVAAMRPGQAIFDFLHLAPEKELSQRILERGIVAIGFETVQLDDGSLPLLVVGCALFGLKEALVRQQKTDDARWVEQAFADAWRNADSMLTVEGL